MRQVLLILILSFSGQVLYAAPGPNGFAVSKNVLQRYKLNYPKLRVGMKQRDVIKLLGNPHSITELSSRTSKKYLGAIYKYYVRRKSNSANARYYDRLFTISFNHQGRLKYAFPHNMINFKRIGFPKEK